MIDKNKVTQSVTNITDKKVWVINMSFKQLIHIETNLLAKGLNFSITSKTLPNTDIIATIEDAVKDLQKVPICPIVSYSGALLYKYMANILKSYVKDENNNAKNSTTFSNYTRNVPIEDDEVMVLFDVTSAYMNIPIIHMLNIIKDYVNNDDQFTRKTAIPQGKFLNLNNMVLTTTWYTFNSVLPKKPMALQWDVQHLQPQ